MKEEGIQVPMTKLCAWFEVPRRTMYYRTVKSAPKVQERFEKPIKEMIEQDPSFGYPPLTKLCYQDSRWVLGKVLWFQVKQLLKLSKNLIKKL